MLSSIRKMYGIYKIMKKITLIIMEGAQFDQSTIKSYKLSYFSTTDIPLAEESE